MLCHPIVKGSVSTPLQEFFQPHVVPHLTELPVTKAFQQPQGPKPFVRKAQSLQSRLGADSTLGVLIGPATKLPRCAAGDQFFEGALVHPPQGEGDQRTRTDLAVVTHEDRIKASGAGLLQMSPGE